MKKPVNHSHLTAKERTAMSFPTKWLLTHKYIQGDVLDFGCGYGVDVDALKETGCSVDGYDKYYQPDLPDKKYDTILCQYVLNVLQPDEQAEVLMTVSEKLKPSGKAYFAVRRDITYEGFRVHKLHNETTYQCVVKLPYKSIFLNESCEIYEYQHYNQLSHRNNDCVFCSLAADRELLCETATALAFYDGFPVNPGHVLVVPKRHVANYFDLSVHEQRAIWLLVNRCKEVLTERFNPDGFNLGININEAAGQTVMHVHVHLIPRYKGDVENPRGGVRGVVPGKKDY